MSKNKTEKLNKEDFTRANSSDFNRKEENRDNNYSNNTYNNSSNANDKNIMDDINYWQVKFQDKLGSSFKDKVDDFKKMNEEINYTNNNVVIPSLINASEGEICVKQYDVATFKNVFMGFLTYSKANCKLLVTNKKVVLSARGRDLKGELNFQNEFSLSDIAGISLVSEYIHNLLFDLAIKQALSRKKNLGNVYLIIDEFSLLPNLSHLNDALNFGRSLGVKFIIGVQNIEQIYDSYKEYQARSILSGLLTSICFKVNEESSRKFIKDLYGRNRKKDTFISAIQNRCVVEQVRDSNVVEDWNISNLKVGEAIIGLANSNPFLYKFKKSK